MPNRAGSRGLARANCVRGRIDGCTCMFLWLRASGREKKKEIKTRWEGLRKLTQKKGRKSDKERNEWWSALETHPRTCTGIYVLIRHTVAVHVRPPSSHDWSTRVRVSTVTAWVEGCRNSASYFAFSLIPAAPSRELLAALLHAGSHGMMPNANSLPILSRMKLITTPVVFRFLKSVTTCFMRGMAAYWCMAQRSIKRAHSVTRE